MSPQNRNATFSVALEDLKSGKKVARKGWNGKNMYLVLNESPGGFDCEMGISRPIAPHILMFTVQKEFVPWLASQTDVLADDWSVVE